MNKKILLFLGVVVGVINVAIVVYFSRQKTPPLESLGKQPVEQSKSVTNTKNWEDPAGFSFSYPQEVAIDPHKEDEENYAYLELTASSHPGRITILVKETDYRDIEAWVEDESAEASVLDTQLAGRTAKKVIYNEPKKMVVAAIDVDALVSIEMDPGAGDYWQAVFDELLNSFKFIPIAGEPTTAPVAGGSGDSGATIVEEAEEVIE